jgi:hypothetical protein
LENSSTSSRPPGLSTRRISAMAASLWVMLRRPKATLTTVEMIVGEGQLLGVALGDGKE